MFNNQKVYVLCNIKRKYNKFLCQDVTLNYDSFFTAESTRAFGILSAMKNLGRKFEMWFCFCNIRSNWDLKEGKEPQNKVDDLDPTEDGEASEETHCAPNQCQLSLCGHLHFHG